MMTDVGPKIYSTLTPSMPVTWRSTSWTWKFYVKICIKVFNSLYFPDHWMDLVCVWINTCRSKINSAIPHPVTWPRWPPCPYVVKNFKNVHPQNQKTNDLETWYLALGSRVLLNICKWWPFADVDLFYYKVKFGSLGF